MKKLFKNLVGTILGWQVRRLRGRHNFKVVAVAGSIGKTSTKLALARVLSQAYKVRYQQGNYNDLVSVPFIFFGQEFLPNIFNPIGWILVFWQNEWLLRRRYPYEVVVLEYSIDGPGQMKQFGRFGRVDLAILTAITPEHMEFFADLDEVADEELAVADLADELLVNADLCPAEYLNRIAGKAKTYGVKQPADIRLSNIKFDGPQASFDVVNNGAKFLHASHEQINEPLLYSVCGTVAAAIGLEMTPTAIEKGIAKIHPVSGRMQHLKGINDSFIIDDTYNASPEAMRAALDTLYRLEAPQKIAILGNMNELGGYSQIEHQKIGQYCDHRELDLVITIGPDANKYLAPAAKSKGCSVETFKDPYLAAEYLKPLIKEGAVILVKGSQNKVFAEETVKALLADPSDAGKLVRQSKQWLKIKQKAFPSVKI
jgi:UDP-N-acetylmuramoyl-tripeptide--D-alanyl-D-alanine ligase